MSSILEALKKLEHEKEESSQDVEWPQPVDTRAALHDRLARRPSYKPVLTGLVLCLMLGASGMLLFRGFSSRSFEPVAMGPAVNPAETATRPGTVPPTPAPDHPLRAKASDMARHDDSPVRPRPDTHPPETAALHPEKTSTVAAVVATAPPAPVGDIRPVHEATADRDLSAMAEHPADMADAELDEDMAELLERIPQDLLPPRKLVESGWLTLHAISWSDDPDRRIAVINAQVVKEGRRLDGALIRRIDRDYVVIEKNGEQLMLPFGSH